MATQMGIQGHSMEGHKLLCEWIGARVIGNVHQVERLVRSLLLSLGPCRLEFALVRASGGAHAFAGRHGLGSVDRPCTMRPHHRAYHPATWRCWWDFGCGMMGDRGAHTIDPVYSALKLTAPTSVEATSCGSTAEVHPLSAIVTFKFPAREGFPPLKLTWYEGTRAPRPDELEDGRQFPAEGGVFLKGTKGTILCGLYGESPRILPEAKMREAKLPPKTIPRVHGSHEQDWVRACKTGQRRRPIFPTPARSQRPACWETLQNGSTLGSSGTPNN